MSLNGISSKSEMDQNSQGVLKFHLGGQINQDSSGVLEKPAAQNFEANFIATQELEIAEIEHFTEIPDFTETTKSSRPIVVKSPTSCHCIDGWELIEKARAQGESRIICTIFHIPEYSATEVAIQKTAIRVMPLGGRCSYPELIRNACRLYKMIASSENPVIFGHGGARRGTNYTDNKHDNIRQVLADRLGKSVTTINHYLTYGKYLSDEAMESLVESKATKKFFEAAQINKKDLIKILEGVGENEDVIREEISQTMLGWHDEYEENGKITSLHQSDESSENSDEEDMPQGDESNPRTLENFEPWEGNSDANDSDLPTRESINDEIKGIGESLICLAGDKEADTAQCIELVQSYILSLSILIQKFQFIENQNNNNNTKEEK